MLTELGQEESLRHIEPRSCKRCCDRSLGRSLVIDEFLVGRFNRADMPKLYGRTFQRFIVCLGLAILVVLAYWPVRHNGFIETDDPDYITQNPRVSTGLTAGGMRWAFTTFH